MCGQQSKATSIGEQTVMDFSSDQNSLAQSLEFPFPRDTSSLLVVTPDLMML